MLVNSATLADLHDLYAGLGAATPPGREWHSMHAQVAIGPAWTLRFSGASGVPSPPVAMIGILHSAEESEVWVRMGAGSSAAMPAIVRVFRRLVRREADLIGRCIVARVSGSNRPGLRMARAVGMIETGRRCGPSVVLEIDGGGDGVRVQAGGEGAQLAHRQ